MSKEKGTTIITAQAGVIVPGAVPDFLGGKVARGAETVKSSDMTMPFLRLGQDKTPQVIAKQAEQGDWVNSVTSENYGSAVEIIVVLATVGQLRFGKFGSGEGILCRSADGETAEAHNGMTKDEKPTNKCGSCVYAQWTKGRGGKDEAPECSKQAKYLVLVKTPTGLARAVLVMARTSWPIAKKINSILAASQVDTFATVLRLTSEKKDNYHVPAVERVSYATKEEWQHGEDLYLSMVKSFGTLAMHDEGAEHKPETPHRDI